LYLVLVGIVLVVVSIYDMVFMLALYEVMK